MNSATRARRDHSFPMPSVPLLTVVDVSSDGVTHLQNIFPNVLLNDATAVPYPPQTASRV